MKLKFYTLTTFCLFFMLKVNAQITDPVSSISNEIDLKLLVKDSPHGQTFSLQSEKYHDVFHEINSITYNISLDYQSSQQITSYFGLKCHFDKINNVDPIAPADPILTATAPVIIPPIKKKKREVRGYSETYPHLAKIIYRLHSENYKVTIELLKYNTFEDYIAKNDNYIVNTSKVIYLDARHNISSNSELSAIAHPNPSINYLTIELTQSMIGNIPLEVLIFNDRGIKVSQHTLTKASTPTNSALYNLDTSQLQKGTYYVQLSHGGKTQVKTIIKE